MSLTLPVRMGATILDGFDCNAVMSSYTLVDPTASFNDIITYWQDWLAAVDALTDGQITAAALHVTPRLPDGLKTSPVTTARVDQTGVLNFMATGDTHRWGMAIPALSNGVTVQSDGKIVLTPGSPAADLINFLLTGASILEWTNSSQQGLASFRDSLISFRQRTRRPPRVSH